MKPIVVVGSINMDLVSRTESFPKIGETVTGLGFEMHSGGKGANQAVAIARLGYPAILLGAVGTDLFGQNLLSTLKSYGVDTSHIKVEGKTSGTASIVVDSRGENAIIVTPGANAAVDSEYLKTKLDLLKNAGLVLTQLEIPLETVEWLADCCCRHNVPLMLDPAPARSLPTSLLQRITWFTPNEIEAAFYSRNRNEPEESLAYFSREGIKNVILKQGRKGALVATADGHREWIDAFAVDVLDTTAAGDAFNGAFAVSLMKGNTVRQSARFAAAAAAVSVSRRGAQPSLAQESEVLSILAHTKA
jgi:ribokinase